MATKERKNKAIMGFLGTTQPEDLIARIKKSAAANRRSISSEIRTALEQAFCESRLEDKQKTGKLRK